MQNLNNMNTPRTILALHGKRLATTYRININDDVNLETINKAELLTKFRKQTEH